MSIRDTWEWASCRWPSRCSSCYIHMMFSSSGGALTCIISFYPRNSLPRISYYYPSILISGLSLRPVAQTNILSVMWHFSLSLSPFISSIITFSSLHLQGKSRVQPLVTTSTPSFESRPPSFSPLTCCTCLVSSPPAAVLAPCRLFPTLKPE